MPNFSWNDGRAATQALYHFDNAGGHTAIDSSLYSRDMIQSFYNSISAAYFGGGGGAPISGHSQQGYRDSFNYNMYGQWTIDFWCYINSQAANTYYCAFQDLSGDNGQGSIFYYIGSTNYMAFEHRTSTSTYYNEFSMALNSWTHIAAVKTSTTNIDVYKNGTKSFSLTVSGVPSSIGKLGVFYYDYTGHYGTVNDLIYGKIDELRISSTARWVANFTPPTSAYVY